MPTSTHILTSEDKKTAAASTRFVVLCGRIIIADKTYFPRVEYRGRTIYLCTDACLGAFLADPDLFYKVHRNSEKVKKT
jgi:YHS domain-containing protein